MTVSFRPAFGLARLLWLALGVGAIALAGIGVILPILPTTPLVILAAFAFSKSSPALERRLVQSRTFGPMIADWRAHGAIAPRHKTVAVTMMGAVLAVSLVLGVSGVVLAIQALCLAGAAAFVLSRPHGPRR